MTFEYVDILRTELARRCEQNRRYSLRAFARDIGISPPMLSEILNRKKGMSVDSAMMVADTLALPPEKAALFCDSVQASHGRTEAARRIARSRLNQFYQNHEFKILNEELTKVLSEWRHVAIMELIGVDAQHSRPEVLAKRLNLSEHEVEDALARLARVGLIQKEDGVWRKVSRMTASKSDMPNHALRNYTINMHEMGIKKIKQLPVSERDYSTSLFLINRKQLEKFKSDFRKLRRSLMQDYETKGARDLYCLATQFFPLTNPELRESKHLGEAHLDDDC